MTQYYHWQGRSEGTSCNDANNTWRPQ